jgi:uncharacterized protein YkwD
VKNTRRLILLLVGVVAGLIATLLPSGVRPAAAAIDVRAAEAEFFSLLNVTRAANGKLPVVRDPGLDQLALDWSGKMSAVFDITATVIDAGDPHNCNKSALCHRPNLADFLGPIDSAWTAGGENVGTGGTVSGLNDAFIASKGHFDNIIGNYNRLGVGAVEKNGRIWVTFNFMMGPPLAAPTPPPAPTPITPGVNAAAPIADAPKGLAVQKIGAPSYFRSTSPLRVVDTRIGQGGQGPIAEKSIFTISFANEPSLPADAVGVTLNVTAVSPGAAGYLTVYPCDKPTPVASNINFAPDAVVPNLVTVAFSPSKTVCIYTSARLHLLADLAGWLTKSAGATPSAMTTSDPDRLMDSRGGERASVFTLKLTKIPADASAVGLNITVVDPTEDGFLTAYPCGRERPTASNVNYKRGQTVPNMAVVAVGVNQQVCFYSDKPTHLFVDSASYFSPVGGLLTAVVPDRLLDTRESVGGWLGKLGKGQTVSFGVRNADLPGIPGNASGVLLNVTAVDPSAAGFVTVFPCTSTSDLGAGRPNASNLNFVPGANVANLVTVRVPADGKICIYSDQRVHIIADLQAVITPASAA